MVDFKGLAAKAKQFAQRNPDKLGKVIDQAGNLVDRRTGRKYERHVDTAQRKARDLLGGGPASGGRPGEQPTDGTGRPPAGRPPTDGRPGGDVPGQDPLR